jgi:hypothetical protein
MVGGGWGGGGKKEILCCGVHTSNVNDTKTEAQTFRYRS